MKSKEPRNKCSVRTMKRLFELHTPFHLEFKPARKAMHLRRMMRPAWTSNSRTARSKKDNMKSKEPRNKCSVQTMERLFELHSPFHLEFKRAREATRFLPISKPAWTSNSSNKKQEG